MNQGLAAFALHWPTSICVNAHGVINLSKISILKTILVGIHILEVFYCYIIAI